MNSSNPYYKDYNIIIGHTKALKPHFVIFLSQFLLTPSVPIALSAKGVVFQNKNYLASSFFASLIFPRLLRASTIFTALGARQPEPISEIGSIIQGVPCSLKHNASPLRLPLELFSAQPSLLPPFKNYHNIKEQGSPSCKHFVDKKEGRRCEKEGNV